MMYGPEKSDPSVVCAGQRVVQEGSSPSGARMRSVISERGGNASRAGERRKVWRSLHRARRRKLDTAKTDLKPPLAVVRRAGCPSSEYRKMESGMESEKM